MAWPTCEVRCSCGRTAVIRWSARLDRYYCRKRGWKYHSDCNVEKGTDDSRLWHCGRDGHYQNGLRTVRGSYP